MGIIYFRQQKLSVLKSLVSYKKALNSLRLQQHCCPVISQQNGNMYMAIQSLQNKIKYAIKPFFLYPYGTLQQWHTSLLN